LAFSPTPQDAAEPSEICDDVPAVWMRREVGRSAAGAGRAPGAGGGGAGDGSGVEPGRDQEWAAGGWGGGAGGSARLGGDGERVSGIAPMLPDIPPNGEEVVFCLGL